MTPARALGKLGAMLVRSRLALISVVATVVAGCSGGTETGNPPVSGALSYVGFSSEPARIGVRDGGEELTVRQSWLDLDRVSFSTRGGCGLSEAATLTLPGIGVGDHAAGNHVVTSFESTPAAFCRVELPFVRADAPTSGPSELAGNSVLLLAELADGTPVSIASSSTPIVELAAGDSGFRGDAGRARVLLAFDFATWLDGLDFGAAERSDGAIWIDRERNTALLEAFEGRLSRGVSLHADGDGDGTLDPGSEPIAEAR